MVDALGPDQFKNKEDQAVEDLVTAINQLLAIATPRKGKISVFPEREDDYTNHIVKARFEAAGWKKVTFTPHYAGRDDSMMCWEFEL